LGAGKETGAIGVSDDTGAGLVAEVTAAAEAALSDVALVAIRADEPCR
jgi:hypothetical protein